MTRVNISTLKARLSFYLSRARGGEPIEVVDRATPVARLVPVDSTTLQIEEPKGRPSDLLDLPRVRTGPAVDAVQLLAEDRRRR